MTRKRRGGLTLMEVLVTIFIMGIGLLAILTLFPQAAVNMLRAVKDDRSYQCGRSMDGLFRSYWKAEIVEKAGAGDPALFNTFDDPNFSNALDPHVADPNRLVPAGLDEWSYPVVVDPWGYMALRPNSTNPFASRNWIGDAPTNVPRRSLALFGPTPNPAYVFSTLSLKDTTGYEPENLRLTADRAYQYNAMAIVQRPQNRNRYTAFLTVVVFDERAPLFAPGGVETPYTATTFTPGSTTVAVTHAPGAGPDVRIGGWVMDATVGAATSPRPLIRHANMYQVVSVTPDPGGNPGITYLEVQTPVQTPTDNNATAYTGTLVVLNGVSGVYPRQPLNAGQ